MHAIGWFQFPGKQTHACHWPPLRHFCHSAPVRKAVNSTCLSTSSNLALTIYLLPRDISPSWMLISNTLLSSLVLYSAASADINLEPPLRLRLFHSGDTYSRTVQRDLRLRKTSLMFSLLRCYTTILLVILFQLLVFNHTGQEDSLAYHGFCFCPLAHLMANHRASPGDVSANILRRIESPPPTLQSQDVYSSRRTYSSP